MLIMSLSSETSEKDHDTGQTCIEIRPVSSPDLFWKKWWRSSKNQTMWWHVVVSVPLAKLMHRCQTNIHVHPRMQVFQAEHWKPASWLSHGCCLGTYQLPKSFCNPVTLSNSIPLQLQWVLQQFFFFLPFFFSRRTQRTQQRICGVLLILKTQTDLMEPDSIKAPPTVHTPQKDLCYHPSTRPVQDTFRWSLSRPWLV